CIPLLRQNLATFYIVRGICDMTPDERFRRIENAMLALTEFKARQEGQIANVIAQVEKQNAGIRDLIVVSRTVIYSQQQTNTNLNILRDQVSELTNQVAELGDQVAELTRNVDALLKGLHKPNGNR